MQGTAARAPARTDARSAEGILRQLGGLWDSPALADLTVALNPRLSRTLARLVARPRRIELGPRALANEKRLRKVVTHEAARAALASRDDATSQAPHGPTGGS